MSALQRFLASQPSAVAVSNTAVLKRGVFVVNRPWDLSLRSWRSFTNSVSCRKPKKQIPTRCSGEESMKTPLSVDNLTLCNESSTTKANKPHTDPTSPKISRKKDTPQKHSATTNDIPPKPFNSYKEKPNNRLPGIYTSFSNLSQETMHRAIELGTDPFAFKSPIEAALKTKKNEFSRWEGTESMWPYKVADDVQWKRINWRIRYKKVTPHREMPVPGLAHQLDRVLFSPGVHRLQDPTTKEYNFNPFLEYITQPADFNYDALRAYITSSKDESLLDLAIAHKQRYVGSTSSISSAMSHFYFTMSNFKPVNLDNLSEPFQTESDRFTRGNRAPTTICLRWNRGVYAIDADKSFDVEDTILSLMGRSMEKVLTLEPEKYKNYLKENSEGWAKDSKDLESYAYGKIGKFLLRSQLDCYHPDLKRGTFDLKTRAVIPIRLDMPNYSEYLGYTLKDNCGLLQSFEREYYDMIRSAFLKYNFQVRIGHMDGIMVTYHNTRKMFGFQYISRDEIDTRLFGSKQMGGEVFRNILVMFEEVLDMATKKYPEQTLRLSFEAQESDSPYMNIFVEAVPPTEETEEKEKERNQELKETVAAVQARMEMPAMVVGTEEEAEQLEALEEKSIDYPDSINPNLNSYEDITLFRLSTQSFLNGVLMTEHFTKTSKKDRWDVEYNISESNLPSKQVKEMFSTLRSIQSTVFTHGNKRIPILKVLKQMSDDQLASEEAERNRSVLAREKAEEMVEEHKLEELEKKSE